MDLEDAARQLLERVLIDARVVQRDLNSGVSVHDFDIIRSDESVEALEVTRFTDQKLRALGARLDSFAKSFNTEAIAQRWWVGLTEAVLDWGGPREVAEELVPLLADLEASGTYDFQCDLPPTPNTPEVQTLCERLPVSNGQTLGTKAHPRLMLGIPSFVTSFSPDDINRALEHEARRSDNRAKLAASGSEVRHLFVWVEHQQLGAAAALASGAIPPAASLELPDEITVGWVALEDEGVDRVLRCSPPAPWEIIPLN
jgi:hypothetical protein